MKGKLSAVKATSLWAIGKRPLGQSPAWVRRNRRAARIVAYRRGDRPFILAIEPLMRTLQLRFEQVVERRDPPVGTVCLGYDECVLWCGKREFLGSPLEGPLPPECDVRRPDPQCPVHVDSSQSVHSVFGRNAQTPVIR